uniref:Uncharacterized protein LOC105056028 n=1 Tax=Elaeis guineensis var. tenera TaxID=51953 RepID=A0A6J0PQG5_ELAGV
YFLLPHPLSLSRAFLLFISLFFPSSSVDAAPATKGPIPNPAGDWTVVSRRRRGKQWQRDPHPDPTRPRIKTLALTPTASSPWTPIYSVIEPARKSKLLQRMQSAVRRLEGSRFYQRFLSRLRDAKIRNGLARVLGSGREFQMVVYGIGSIESYDPPRLQFALAVLLRREFGPAVASVDVFDPVLSATECAVVRALGCTVVPMDEQGRREATVPTLFYMPHCEAALYDALLEANWRPSMLNRMVVLGNSFAAYDKYMEEVAWSNGSVALRQVSTRSRRPSAQDPILDADIPDGKNGPASSFHRKKQETISVVDRGQTHGGRVVASRERPIDEILEGNSSGPMTSPDDCTETATPKELARGLLLLHSLLQLLDDGRQYLDLVNQIIIPLRFCHHWWFLWLRQPMQGGRLGGSTPTPSC